MWFGNRVLPYLAALSAACIMPLTTQAETPKQAVRNISQMDVDQQQLRQAIASRTLTWLTGSSSNNDYVSVGRLANFFGFVGLRVSSGHSLSRADIAKQTFHVLNSEQDEALIKLVALQKDAFEDVDRTRRAMNRGLEGLLVSEPMTREQFLVLGAEYGAAEAELGRVIGQALGEVAQSLTDRQRTALADIRSRYISGQEPSQKVPGIKTKLSQEDKKELVNIAARLLSWTTGSEAFNDFEVVGKPSQHFGFVSLRVESNHGITRGGIANEVRELLTKNQDATLNAAAEQNVKMFKDFMGVRTRLMRLLETAQDGEIIAVETVKDLGSQMGRLEADMTWAQAAAMLSVRNTMTEQQLSDLLAMRAKYTGAVDDAAPIDSVERGRQLYAQCSLCHNEDRDLAIAPSLSHIVGRAIASDTSYDNYSGAMKAFAKNQETWNEKTLAAFFTSPKSLIPGTYMAYTGLEEEADREAIIGYLKSRE